jgi:hypothetical protein
MAQHEIEVEIPKTMVVNTDVMIIVKSNGRQLGQLTFSRGTIDWRRGLSRSPISMRWEKFDQLMHEQGVHKRRPTR